MSAGLLSACGLTGVGGGMVLTAIFQATARNRYSTGYTFEKAPSDKDFKSKTPAQLAEMASGTTNYDDWGTGMWTWLLVIGLILLFLGGSITGYMGWGGGEAAPALRMY